MKTRRKFRLTIVAISAIMIASSSIFADQILKLDMYDQQDNHLMYVTFEYDQGGKNISRAVYMSDGTFIRKTNISYDAQGNRTKEVSLNFDDDTILTTNYSKNGNIASFNIQDQFKMDQLGGPVSYGTSDPANFDIAQGNSTINKMSYEYDGKGRLSKVNVNDKSESLLYYAAFSYSDGVIGSVNKLKYSFPGIVSKGNNCIELHFTLQVASKVKCDLMSLSGKRVATIFNKDLKMGTYKEAIHFQSAAPQLASGLYLTSISINGAKLANGKCIVHSSRGGF